MSRELMAALLQLKLELSLASIEPERAERLRRHMQTDFLLRRSTT